MSPEEVRAHFSTRDGGYHFARWGRPIVPVVFGVEEATLGVVKGAIEALVALAGHRMAETDPELGANLMLFFLRDWAEVPLVPGLDGLVPDLSALCARLEAGGAGHYRLLRFEPDGAIKAAFAFVRIADDLAEAPAEDLALNEAARLMLLWSETAFAGSSPLGLAEGGRVLLRPEIALLIRAAYDPVLPRATRQDSHALRLAARVGAALGR
ncbi:MAG: hypothetical protein ACT4N9_01600 [Paracoccaceae bacterium]